MNLQWWTLRQNSGQWIFSWQLTRHLCSESTYNVIYSTFNMHFMVSLIDYYTVHLYFVSRPAVSIYRKIVFSNPFKTGSGIRLALANEIWTEVTYVTSRWKTDESLLTFPLSLFHMICWLETSYMASLLGVIPRVKTTKIYLWVEPYLLPSHQTCILNMYYE